MINQNLLDYIKQQLMIGHDKQAVKEALLNAGWAEQDINETFDFFFTSSHSVQPPVQQPFEPSHPSQPALAGSIFLGPIKLLSNAWALYKQRFWTLIAIVLMLIPTLFIITTTIGISWVSAFIFSKIISGGFLLPLLILALAVLAMFLVQLWGQAALLFAIVNHRERIGFIESYRRGWHKILSLWWISILMVFVTLGGFLLAIIPGVIFTIWFGLSTIILIAEDSRGMNALLKSREYVRGRWWGVLGRGIFIGLLSFIFYIIIPTLILSLVLVFKPTLILSLVSVLFKAPAVLPVVLQVIYYIVLIIWTPLVWAYLFLIYQNLRNLRGEVDLAVNKKSKTAFIIIALLGIILMPVLLYWAVFSKLSAISGPSLNNLGNYTQTSSTVPKETADWQTYRSDKFKLEFKYPPGFEVVERSSGLYLAKNKVEFYDIGSSNAFFILISDPDAIFYIKDSIQLKNLQVSTTVIDKRIFQKIQGDDYGRYEGDSAGKVLDISLGNNTTIHVEEKPGGKARDFNTIETADQILSTFKFIK